MKKVFIGVLCALMLFGFVACDNNTPSGMVYSIEATQTAVYVDGETPTADGFSFVGYTNLGEAVSIDASKIAFYPAGSNRYTMTYMGMPVANSVVVDFEDITGLSVDATGSTAVYYAVLPAGTDVNGKALPTTRDIDKTGIVVTAEYEGGSKVIANDQVDFNLALEEDWTAGEDKDVVVSFGEMTDTYTIDVQENLVLSLVSAMTEDYTLYAGVSGHNAAKWATNVGTDNETEGLYLALTYQGGETVAFGSDTGIRFLNISGSYQAGNIATYIATADTTSAIPVSVKYVGANGIQNLTRTATFSVPVREDAVDPETITVTGVNTLDNIDYSAQGTTPSITVSAKMLSGTNATGTVSFWNGTGNPTDAKNYYTLSPVDLSDYTDYETYSIRVYGYVGGVAFDKSYSVVLDGVV